MDKQSDTVELLEAAFPAERGAAMGTCGWCGAPRKRRHALCLRCWGALSTQQRREYLELLDIIDRARWIVTGKEWGYRSG